MQYELNLKRSVVWLAVATVAVWLMAGRVHAADGPQLTTAGSGATMSTTVLSLEGNDWVVTADPNNVGRDAAWWKSPRPEAKPIRVPGIIQESLPRYHGVAWLYHKECVAGKHPFLDGLQAPGVMDWDYYGPLISHQFFEGQDPPRRPPWRHSPSATAAGLMVMPRAPCSAFTQWVRAGSF